MKTPKRWFRWLAWVVTMMSTRLLVMVVSIFMAVGNTGCVHAPKPDPARPGLLCTVSLPPLKLEAGESIQSVEVTIVDGRIATINRTWDDWDLALVWDSPGELELKCHARHFVSGFQSTQKFGRFITVRVGPLLGDSPRLTSFDIMATVRTGSTDKTGRGERDYHFSRSDIVLSPSPPVSVWRKRDPFSRPSEVGVYFVQWGYGGAEIAEHFHLTMEQLSLLNPGVDLSHLKVGQALLVSAQTRK